MDFKSILRIHIQAYVTLGLVLAFAFISCNSSADIEQRRIEAELALEAERVKQEAIENELRKQKELEIIKKLEYVWFADRINIYNAMNALAGIEGTVDWTIVYPEEYKDKPHLCVIIGDSKGLKKGKENVIHIEMLYNKNTGQSETRVATENGKAMNGLEFMMLLALSGAGWTSGGM